MDRLLLLLLLLVQKRCLLMLEVLVRRFACLLQRWLAWDMMLLLLVAVVYMGWELHEGWRGQAACGWRKGTRGLGSLRLLLLLLLLLRTAAATAR
jgi:hypothetical protein